MPEYARSTSVSPEQSRIEIERILKRYGATSFAYAWEGDPESGDAQAAVLYFKYDGKAVRFDLPMPTLEEYRYTPKQRQRRGDSAMHTAWEQGCKQRWRALVLVIKAKLEAIESKITTFDTEFLPHMMLPGGQTVADTVLPQVEEAYREGGGVPRLLPSKTPPERMLPDRGDPVEGVLVE